MKYIFLFISVIIIANGNSVHAQNIVYASYNVVSRSPNPNEISNESKYVLNIYTDNNMTTLITEKIETRGKNIIITGSLVTKKGNHYDFFGDFSKGGSGFRLIEQKPTVGHIIDPLTLSRFDLDGKPLPETCHDRKLSFNTNKFTDTYDFVDKYCKTIIKSSRIISNGTEISAESKFNNNNSYMIPEETHYQILKDKHIFFESHFQLKEFKSGIKVKIFDQLPKGAILKNIKDKYFIVGNNNELIYSEKYNNVTDNQLNKKKIAGFCFILSLSILICSLMIKFLRRKSKNSG